LVATIVLACRAVDAHAHVKWFADHDVTKPPLPIGDVLTGTFTWCFVVAVACVYGFVLVDRYVYRRRYLAALDHRLRRLDAFSIRVIRLTGSVFFLSLWAWHVGFGTSFFLTPELKTALAIVPWLHLAAALCLLSRATTPIGGICVFVLYTAAVQAYGLYHMLDYVVFLGLGYFYLVSHVERGRWRQSGFVVLYATTGLTLAWTAVEKFAYPHWAYPLLGKNPAMMMGLDPQLFMVLAGFVEFTVAFVLLSAASVIGRLVALGLQSIFVLAIFEFGMLDAIGHLMIIAVLFVLLVRGPTNARNMLVLRDKAVWTEAYFVTGLYFLAFVTSFILYYGLHHVHYGAVAPLAAYP
jgi:hypothetical protein